MTGLGTPFGRQFALREPRILIVAALVVALIAILWFLRGRGTVPARALILRALVLLALAFALAGPLLAQPSPSGATIFVVDRSRSMGDDDARLLSAQIVAALGSSAAREPVGLVAFSERAATVYPVGTLTAATDPEALGAALRAADTGSRDYTAVADALRLAESLPSAGGRRIVLFSDGQETVGGAIDWAAGASGRGVVVDAVAPAARRLPNDVRVTDMRVPDSLWQGDVVEIAATLAGDTPGQVAVQLLVDGQVAVSQNAALSASTSAATGTASFVLRPLTPGYHAIAVRVAPATGDPIAENNTLAATTVVRDRPRVLIVEGTPGGADGLRRSLTGGTFTVTVRAPGALPDRAADLNDYDAIVLADVPATALSEGKQQALQDFVRKEGRGLVVTGGMQSFGKGGYEGSTLEAALPVRVKPRAEGKRPPAALLLIIDASGSMGITTTSPTRMEMAKSAAAQAVRALSPGDDVAVLAFNDKNVWVQHLRTINSTDDINGVVAQISRLQAEGVTEMYGALTDGIAEIQKSQAGTKHIILLSDGEPTSRFDPDEAAGRARKANVTLSTIAIGQAADVTLMGRLAAVGNGRYQYAPTPQDIPRLTLEEAEQLAGKTFATGDFRAVQTSPSPILRGLEPGSLPTLGGYQITEAKPGAQAILQSGKGEPVLAQWQYGLGRVVTWTSDLGQSFAPSWSDSSVFPTFWNQAVRWSLAAAVSPSYRVTATPDGKDTILAVDAFDSNGGAVDLATPNARLRTPSGQAVDLMLPQSAPGRYEVRLAAPQPGAYSLELRQARGGQTATDTVGFSVPYPAELRGPTLGDTVLGALADRTGGRVLSGPEQIFDRTVLTATPQFRDIWPPFAILALLLFLLDTAIRLGYAATSGRALKRLMPR